MRMTENDKIAPTRKEMKKLHKLAESIYGIAIVLDIFCSSQPDIVELHALTPVVKNLRRISDNLYVFFLEFFENENI